MSDFAAFLALLQQDVPLAPRTTIGLGGPARFYADVNDVTVLCEGLSWAAREKLPVLILGGGSNLVLPDEGVQGLVLRLAMSGIRLEDSSQNGEERIVTAAAGTPWDTLVETTVDAGLSGLECLSGIPGTVGATPIQNVGAYGQEVAQCIESVECLDRATLQRRVFSAAECDFAYRQSRFKAADRDRFVILSVGYRLRSGYIHELRYGELQERLAARFGSIKNLPAGVAGLRAIRETVLELRRGKSMVVDADDPNTRSVGSFFMNPVLAPADFERVRQVAVERGHTAGPPAYSGPTGTKVPAAWLIEHAGFSRGYRRPGAAISSKHTLALINPGDGTRRNLLELAAEIRVGVERVFGVRLEIEPEIYGLPENFDHRR